MKGRALERVAWGVACALVSACAANERTGFPPDDTGEQSPDASRGAPSGVGDDAGGGGDNAGGNIASGAGNAGGSDAAASSDGAPAPVDVMPSCDQGLAIDGDATAFAKAIGICATVAENGWGLVSASYSNGFGSQSPPAPSQSGLLPSFGSVIVPREGALLGAISSGYGRVYDDDTGGGTDFVDGVPRDGTSYPTGQAPPGYPKAAQNCPQDNVVNDMIDVRLVLLAPPDASGFSFDFDFFTSEWPNYVCSNFNDAFVAYLTSSATTDNIAFDTGKNPVAVNMSFLDRCTPGAPVGCLRSNTCCPTPDPPLRTSKCAAGPAELGGTGYGDTFATQCDPGVANVVATLGASTGWLTTTAPIQPGEQFTLEFMIWDAGDGLLDSSALVDHFTWLGGSVPTQTQRPPR